jgi:UDP-2-acetamido-2,6-beta-L-arabino-hexul-4-ose reductase
VKTVLVTGSKGFIGKNLIESLSRQKDVEIYEFDVDDDMSILTSALKEADLVFHLAGINRPKNDEEFIQGNTVSTQTLLSILDDLNRTPTIVMSSSVQAELSNPYGVSKKKAEDLLFEYGERTGASVYVYRLTNVFGKWCRPNYNSVVATFCHNIANGLEISISDRAREIQLVYIDDVVESFLNILEKCPEISPRKHLTISPAHKITLGSLADRIYQFRDMRKSLVIPNLSEYFTRCLYATYLSYLSKDNFTYDLEKKSDQRGILVELFKSKNFGQIFISKTRGGVTRGNHYHNTKTEKFCVIQGKAVIRFRHIFSNEVLSYHVSGDDIKIVDIPPGYTHNIENISDDELIVLFWADQIFDPDKPDTHFDVV